MPFYNSYPGFLYRQFLVCPSKAPSTTSLRGKAGIVTGSNTGLGYQASAQLLGLGLSYLILAVRSISKGEAARKSLLASLPASAKPPVIEIWELDLGSYASIIVFVDRLRLSEIQIDFALLNAGVANFNFTVNQPTSHETTIQINWLSTALLTLLLLPELDRQAANNLNRARPVISIVGSETAAWAKFAEAQVSTKQEISLIDVLDDKSHFDMGDRYYASKLLYQLFFLELFRNRSSAKRSTGAILNLVNPGFCYGSELHRTAEGAFATVLGGMKRVIGRSISMGARTLVHSSVLAGEPSNGKYLSDNKPAPFAGYGDSDSGIITQAQVWKETLSELGPVVNIDKLLSEI
ncbi:Short-chain dehydrogenase/reductase SDR [Penicillium concentricum]|uniref:Short-chain dehydrogenase/reductase SDR n=1 Tax=Penicillium concentricum TaxID=293559 RepID=A0A9W9SPQ5_9EURO|nr:Short-chain dehydrogenase/reductase SDR [Penicillium concentricum]KAJ5382396.1 Short-chain dehydrogenase/reductase SDR [Penicillium concentricum]